MTLWLVIPLAVLLVAIVVIISSSIAFDFRLSKLDKNDRIVLDISFLHRLVKLHYVLPSVVYEGMTQGIKVKLEESGIAPNIQKDKDAEENIDKDVVDNWLANFKKALRATEGLKQLLKDTLSHLKITTLDWSTDFSLGDAAGTATAAGALWGLKWSIVGWASQWIRLQQEPKLFVKPVFEDELSYATEIVCKGKISVLHVCMAGLRLVVRTYKVEGGFQLWRELLFNRDDRQTGRR
ncbi:DUF2953 domain-containing protein [Paenibacillus sp. sgz500958]|uniref:DUF2953 domain-containing protein n=1 Tax=Paenibacillus sp. sgz500958 TaxID=3242475 RepID=UPI0036D21DD5